MAIPEQLPPNQPNFKLILGLFCLSIIVVIIMGIFFLRHNAGKMLPNGAAPKQSLLIRPIKAITTLQT